MKKFIAIIIAFVMLIGVIFVPQGSASDIKAGKGDGDNKTITKFSKFIELLENTDALLDGDDEIDGVTINAKLDNIRDYSYSEGATSTAVDNVERAEVNAYITEDEILYDMSCMSSSYTFSSLTIEGEQVEVTVSMYLDFDVQYYINEDKDRELIKFTRINASMNGVALTPKEASIFLNQWIDLKDCEEEEDEETVIIAQLGLFSLPVLNIVTAVAGVVGTLANVAETEKGDYSSDGGKYTMKEDEYKEYSLNYIPSTPFYEDITCEGELVVDLSKEEKPAIKGEFNLDLPEIFEGKSLTGAKKEYPVKSGVNKSTLEITFSNIDNTEIDYNLSKSDIISAKELINALKDAGITAEYEASIERQEERDEANGVGDEDGEEGDGEEEEE